MHRQVDQDLHAINARRKRRHDETARRAREDLFERLDDFELRPGEAPAVDVCAVGKERQHAGRSELRKPVQIEMLPVGGGLIDLEITRVDDDAGRRVNGQRHTVGNAVRYANELDLEGPDSHAIARPYGCQTRAGDVDAVFDELGFDQRQRQRRAEHRALYVRHHVRHATDVVLVTVRQHQGGDRPLLLEVSEIRQNQIHTQQLRIRKHHAGIDHDCGLLPGERQHVHAELAQAAQGHNL